MDTAQIYRRLAPYIQEYIYRQGWSELRPVQLAAAQVLFETEDHLLLSSGTASGKTEAAFLPALTLLSEQPAQSVGILYVSPLKALINDQFARLQGLLEAGGIPVTKWHGEASAGGKARLLLEPDGLLQITPESLESLLMHKGAACLRLFRDLRFVIIDEVHYFMASERGLQLQCLLHRIERMAGCKPRRIGLSATLGDSGEAMHWLSEGTQRPCRHPEVPDAKRHLLLWMHRFDALPGDGQHTLPAEEGMESALYRQTLGKKTIIFTKSRLEAVMAIAGLKRIAAAEKSPDVYHVHHGSISAALREQAEREMKRSTKPIVTGATVTLELGLDIGGLDRVIQLGAPVSASSFTQRIGRCGRQGQAAELLFFLHGNPPPELPPGTGQSAQASTARSPSPLWDIDWDFIKAIAIVQLYLEERWIEPIRPQQQCFGLVYHQTMCVLAAAGELSPQRLAQEILTLPAFRHIEQEDYRDLLRHLLAEDHLQRSESGGLLIGYSAEPIVTGYDFLAVFTAPEEFQVRHKGETVGTVNQAIQPGERLVLAGHSWEVLKCDEARRILSVQPAKGHAETKWESNAVGRLHRHLLARMRSVLEEDTGYAYLSPQSKKILQRMREEWQAALAGASAEGIVPMSNQACRWYPFVGTQALQTLQLALLAKGISAYIAPGGFTPVYLELERCNAAKLQRALRELRTEGIETETLPIRLGMGTRSKFDPFLPEELLQKQVREECLNAGEAMEWLKRYL